MRVLQIGMYNNCGGIESFLINYYRYINKNKIQFDFINMYDRLPYQEEIISLGGKIYNITNVKENPVKCLIELKNIISKNNYNIVHINMLSAANIIPIIAAKLAKTKTVIVHSHSSSLPKGFIKVLLNRLNKHLVKNMADICFACSDLSGKWMFDNKKFIIIKNAIDTKKFIYSETIRQAVRKNLNIENKFVIGNIARFSVEKNHSFLVDIFYQVHKKNPNAVLLFVGDGELKEEIGFKLSELGLIDNVIFTGEVKNANDYLQAMDVFVFPSLFEGLGTALVEAQTAGLQCIISNVIPNEAIIINDLLNVLSLKNPLVWAKEILKYSKGYKRENTYKEIAKAGYDIAKATKHLENIYIKLNAIR